MSYQYVGNANGFGGGYVHVTDNGFIGNGPTHVSQAAGLK